MEGRKGGGEGGREEDRLGSLVSTDNACLPVVMSLENPVFAGERRDN